MGLFRKKKEVPQISEEDELKAMRKDLRGPEEPQKAAPNSTGSAPDNLDVQNALMIIASKEKEARKHMDQGYREGDPDLRVGFFMSAVSLLSEVDEESLKLFKAGTDMSENLDRTRGLTCECALQVIWVACNYDDYRRCIVFRDAIKTFFSGIMNPNAMAHFARAHSCVLSAANDEELAALEWSEISYHYAQAVKLIDTLEVDKVGVKMFSLYNLGLCYKHGWGVEQDKEAARLFLTQAQIEGLDCQDVIDSLD